MDYDLAEELRDAEFPQEGAVCRLNHDHTREHETHMPTCWCKPQVEVQSDGGGLIIIHNKSDDQWKPGCEYEPYRPSLEELIEACGGQFWTLIMSHAVLTSERKEKPWIARAYIVGKELEVYGSTPTEAVARLWLALNKHNTTHRASS